MSCFCSRAPSVQRKASTIWLGVRKTLRGKSERLPRCRRRLHYLSPLSPTSRSKFKSVGPALPARSCSGPGGALDRATKADLAWTAGGLCCLRPRVLLLVLEAISLQRRRPRRRRVRRSMRHLRSQFHKHKPAQIRVLRHSPGRARPKRLKAVTDRARSDRHRRLVRKKGQEFGCARRGRMH
jgi:hypothetical protein